MNNIIIGCGRIGERHAKHISVYGNLIAVCDIEFEKANSLAKKYNVNAYTDLQKMLNGTRDNEIDIISICTPNGLHHEHTIISLKHGLNVLCEKPMALNEEEAANMLQAAETNNKRIFAVKQNRFNPPVLKLKELLNDNKLGQIFSVQLNCFWNRNDNYYLNSWKGTKKLDGGILFTQFSHFIDLIIWLNGDIIESKGYSDNFNHKKTIEFEDTCCFVVKFKNNSIGTINCTINSFSKNMEGSLTIFGSKGTIKIGGQYLNTIDYFDIDGVENINLPKGNKANNYGTYYGSMSNHDKVYENVKNVLMGNDEISTTGFEGYNVVKTIEQLYNSL
jgi:predicted dehydrogenase